MRDSVALGSYVDSRRAFSDSRAWLRKSTRLKHGKNTYDICSLQAVSVLGHVDFQIDPPSPDTRSRSATERRPFERNMTARHSHVVEVYI